jgi:hypothetical protein
MTSDLHAKSSSSLESASGVNKRTRRRKKFGKAVEHYVT